MLKIIVSALCFLGIVGCSHTVNMQRYSLVEDISSIASVNDEYKVNLSVVGVSDNSGIVMQISPVAVQEALSNRWSFNLEDQLTMLLKDNLYKSNVSKQYNFKVTVNRFQGSYLGEAQVAAFFEVRNKNGKIVLNKEFAVNKDLTADGYSELVLRLKDGFNEICEEAINTLL